MKLIDEKGRLFGLINLLDLAVIVGALIAVYVGVSAWIALKSPPLQLESISPNTVQTGSPSTVTASLDNERYLLGARLHLAPKDFEGETVTVTGQFHQASRDSVAFRLPADIAPGSYTPEIEATVMDVFRRKSIQTSRLDKALTVNPAPEPEKVKKRVVTYQGTPTWRLELRMVALSAGMELPVPSPGDSLKYTGMTLPLVVEDISAPSQEDLEQLGEDRRESAAQVISAVVEGRYADIRPLLRGGSEFALYTTDRSLVRCRLLQPVAAELDLMFYFDLPGQEELLEPEDTLYRSADGAAAVVLANFGEAPNPWIDPGTAPPAEGMLTAFHIVRVRMDCRLEDGLLSFAGAALAPNRLIDLESGETTLTAGVLSQQPVNLDARVRVMIGAFPRQLIPLLKPGVQVFNQQGSQAAGTVERVLDIDPVDVPAQLAHSGQPGYGAEFRRVLLELSLDTDLSGDAPVFLGQQIDFGRPLNFVILGSRLQGTVVIGSSLPPRGEYVWEDVQVRFNNVPPELVPWIRPGEKEYSLTGPSSWEIVRVIDTAPATVSLNLRSVEGQILDAFAEHPRNKDILCIVRMKLFHAGGDFYYNGGRLRVGSGVGFTARRWAHGGTLVNF